MSIHFPMNAAYFWCFCLIWLNMNEILKAIFSCSEIEKIMRRPCLDWPEMKDGVVCQTYESRRREWTEWGESVKLQQGVIWTSGGRSQLQLMYSNPQPWGSYLLYAACNPVLTQDNADCGNSFIKGYVVLEECFVCNYDHHLMFGDCNLP